MRKIVNTVVIGLVQDHPEAWESMLPFAERILRCSPMAELGKRSPYEVVTGLKPKMPAAMVAERDREYFPVTGYVRCSRVTPIGLYSVYNQQRRSVWGGPCRGTSPTNCMSEMLSW